MSHGVDVGPVFEYLYVAQEGRMYVNPNESQTLVPLMGYLAVCWKCKEPLEVEILTSWGYRLGEFHYSVGYVGVAHWIHKCKEELEADAACEVP